MSEEEFEEACAKGQLFHHILNARKFDIDHSHGSFVKGITLYLHFSSVSARDIELSVVFMVGDQTVTNIVQFEEDDGSEDYVFSDDTLMIPSEFTVHLHLSKTVAACEVIGAIITRGA